MSRKSQPSQHRLDTRLPRSIAALLLALLVLALASCAGGRKSPGAALAPVTEHPSMAAVLAEINEMQPPQGVDEALFADLREALKAGLLTYGIKSTTTPPTGPMNVVNDLTIWSEEEKLRLMWHYRNVGDYDQDGTVGISDITPLAIHYDEVWGDANSIQAVVDGSGNHKIGIEDITPIAQNYGVNCSGYALQNSPVPDPEDPGWNSIGAFDFSLASGIGRISFVVSAEVGEYPYYRVVPYDSSSVVGVPGEVVDFVPEPPVITGVSPQSGIAGDTVVFTATANGETPMSFYWDMGGGAVPNQPVGSSPMVTLGAIGTYDASVAAINGAGSDTYPFTLEVTEPAVDPPEIVSVSPLEGQEGTLVEFSAVVNGTPPFTYQWDFGGGADPDTPTDESPEVLLSVADEYPASLTVTNAEDEDVFPFALTVTGEPPGPIVIDELGGDYPSAVIVDGNPAVAYRQSSAVYYVRALDSDGATWDEPVEIPCIGGEPGFDNSLAIVSGNPAVTTSVSFMIEGGRIDYARAQNSTGSVWNALVQIWDDATIAPPPSSLCVVNGNPAAAFAEDFAGNDLLYIRATDTSGDTWPGTPVVAAAGVIENSANSCDMKIVKGNPAIAVVTDNWLGDLCYVRALDENGASWGTPKTLYEYTDVAAMAVVSSNPAVVWFTSGELPHALKYKRSNDEEGSEWGSEVTLDDWVDTVGGHIGFSVISGRPAVAYADDVEGNRCLHYVVAKDETGEEWNEAVVADAVTVIRENVALLEVNGSPAIFYCEQEGQGALRYIRALDNFGLEWPE